MPSKTVKINEMELKIKAVKIISGYFQLKLIKYY